MNENTCDRRQWLARAGGGFGMLALTELLGAAERHSASSTPGNPLAAKSLQIAPRARSCIFLFMPGGPSHIDLFDPKSAVQARHGQPLPIKKPRLMHSQTGGLFGSPWKFSRRGQSGLEMSELLPHLAVQADDLCVIRSMKADNINHSGANLQMNTGEQALSRPSLGSWLIYGLGSENANLPGFVVISPQTPPKGAPLWSSSFLPPVYQGTWIQDLNDPIQNVRDPRGDLDWQREKLDALQRLNVLHMQRSAADEALDARISAFELAFRIQRNAPEAFDLSRESPVAEKMYGLDDPATVNFGRQCLMARRLVERGVRFVQLYDTAGGANCWDHHGGGQPNVFDGLRDRCRGVDKPIAGLIADLKQRGLLDQTLIVWGGEFGRTPTVENGDGRGHHPFGFTMFLAGGGVKGGHVHGATDDFGWHAVDKPVHVHDLHATILYLMGVDHERLTYRSGGRDFRLTDVYGDVVFEVMA
jgi:hypothetical protein